MIKENLIAARDNNNDIELHLGSDKISFRTSFVIDDIDVTEDYISLYDDKGFEFTIDNSALSEYIYSDDEDAYIYRDRNFISMIVISK